MKSLKHSKADPRRRSKGIYNPLSGKESKHLTRSPTYRGEVKKILNNPELSADQKLAQIQSQIESKELLDELANNHFKEILQRTRHLSKKLGVEDQTLIFFLYSKLLEKLGYATTMSFGEWLSYLPTNSDGMKPARQIFQEYRQYQINCGHPYLYEYEETVGLIPFDLIQPGSDWVKYFQKRGRLPHPFNRTVARLSLIKDLEAIQGRLSEPFHQSPP